jgi:PEP-CTERM motif
MMGCNLKPGRNGLIAGAALAFVCLGSAAASADITYIVDRTVGTGSVTGTITTNGATGTLNPSDFVAWNLLLTGAGGVSDRITNLDSGAVAWGYGSDVTATTTDLYFNFSGPYGYMVFQDGFESGTHYYCDASAMSACFAGESVVPQSFTDPSFVNVAQSGNQIIGAVIPEPSTWAMMLAGFAGLGLAGYRRARRAAPAPVSA